MGIGRSGWIAAVLTALGVATSAAAAARSADQILRESWSAYAARFIQPDGRVVDPHAGGISTSEGQSYAMLRAVWLRDRRIFDKAYNWGRQNLNTGARKDRLWAWKWGKSPEGRWQVLDSAFATDADQDVALALILASRTWNDERYLQQARAILADLWRLATYEANGTRFLLAGDKLCERHMCRLNPSYYAPYAYRIFARHDNSADWGSLADSSYMVLGKAAELTATRLPPDWIVLDTATGRFSLPESKLASFSYDALRVYWRIAMDWQLFRDPRAERYLKDTLPWLISRWERSGHLPATVSSTGADLAKYESGEMLAALMPAVRWQRPDVAQAMERKLRSVYRSGLWADQAGTQHTYYLQNWAWFGTALYEKRLGPFRAYQAEKASK